MVKICHGAAQAGPQDESRFQIHNAGGIAMALMDSELIYGQIPWAIVTFLQAQVSKAANALSMICFCIFCMVLQCTESMAEMAEMDV